MFHNIASVLEIAWVVFQLLYHHILVKFETVVTVVTVVTVQDNKVTRTSAFVQKTCQNGASLEIYSSIVSNTHLIVHSGW